MLPNHFLAAETQIIHAHNPISHMKQGIYQVTSNKTGAAGNQKIHVVALLVDAEKAIF